MNVEERTAKAEAILDFWNHGPRHAAVYSLDLAMYDEYQRGLRTGKIQGFLGAALPMLGAALAWYLTR